MALTTFSKFYYNFQVTRSNNKINFDEGAGELEATVNIGKYTPTTLTVAIKTAMDAAGLLDYTVTFDRDTRIYTISSDSAFDLLLDTGAQSAIGIYAVIGFNQGVDLTGLLTYSGDTSAGSVYNNQFILQDYLGPNKSKEQIDSSINESANGVIETVSFGVRRFIKMSLKWITNLEQNGKIIKNNPTGVEDLEDFLEYLITKGQLEFMPDKDNTAEFFTVIVESLPGSSNGTGYEIKELVDKNVPGYFEINNLKFRVVE